MRIREILKLAITCCKVTVKNTVEYVQVITRYYGNRAFAKADLLLLLQYLTKNPFRISRQQLQAMGERDVYTYGETPLTALETIAKACRISADDTVFELGSGRGRTCFWLRIMLSCSVVGVEWLSPFVQKARKVANKLSLSRLTFRQEDFLKTSLKGATVIYLYGTCLDEDKITSLCQRFLELPKGTRIITVSYPLKDYSEGFEILRCFPVAYTWGEADVYLQVRN